MRTILNYSNYDPAINAVFSIFTYQDLWWTSTTAAHDSTRAWYYYFEDGQQGYSAKETGNMYARCVTGP
jgi:hypothetical protein